MNQPQKFHGPKNLLFEVLGSTIYFRKGPGLPLRKCSPEQTQLAKAWILSTSVQLPPEGDSENDPGS